MGGDVRLADLGVHPLAELFPLLDGEAYERFKTDIAARGLLHPITTLDGLILDGRNRSRACLDTGVAIRTEPYTGDDPAGYVIASNLHRRHLDEGQRAWVATKLETMKQGRPGKDANLHVLREDAAKLLNVSVRSVASAAVVRDRGIPELGRAVEQGKISVSVAAKCADLPPDIQERAVASPDKAKHLVKQQRRRQREVELAERTIAASKALGSTLYGVIYADPPWQFEAYSDETGMDRAADNHYPTEAVDKIKALKVPAADDAVLFLWATVPMLPQALEVMAAWGFAYKSHFAWIKDKAGTGYWSRNKHELLLIGTRGKIPAPAPGEQYESAIEAKAQEHSRKPFHFREIIEETFPSLPRIELFARERFGGWDAWGNEA